MAVPAPTKTPVRIEYHSCRFLDDGVGVKVVQLLQAEYRRGCRWRDAGTGPAPQTGGKSHLIMVDAVETGKKPGTRVRLAGEELPIALETKISPHQMRLKDLLAVARLLGHAPGEIVLIGVQPGSIEMDTELTPEVAGQVTALTVAVLKELEDIGILAVAAHNHDTLPDCLKVA